MLLGVLLGRGSRPTSGLAPAPSPFSPSCSLTGARLVASACASVLATMNSTPRNAGRDHRVDRVAATAAHPMTLIRAPRPSCPTSSIISNLLHPAAGCSRPAYGNFRSTSTPSTSPTMRRPHAMDQMCVLAEPGQMVARARRRSAIRPTPSRSAGLGEASRRCHRSRAACRGAPAAGTRARRGRRCRPASRRRRSARRPR